jgi:hypothetical protein
MVVSGIKSQPPADESLASLGSIIGAPSLMFMFAKEPECSFFNKTGRIAQGNLVPVTEVQAFTPQPTVAWISWNSTCMNAEGVEMLSSLKIG